MKKLRSILLCFAITFSVISSCYVSSYNVKASGLAQEFLDNLTYSLLSFTGALDTGINNVAQVSNSMYNALRTKINDLWGTGIYEDSNGNIVFSGDATDQLYGILQNQFNGNARIISDFGGVTPYGGLYGLDSPYFHPDVKSFANSGRNLYTEYIAVVGFGSSNGGNTYYSKVSFYDASNISYVTVNESNQIIFWNDNGQQVNPLSAHYIGSYTSVNGFSNVSSSGSDNYGINYLDLRFTTSSNGLSTVNRYGENVYFSEYMTDVSNITFSLYFNRFPFYGGNRSLIWSNRSIIIGTDVAQAISLNTQSSGTFVTNTYNSYSISKTVVENNNWRNIYNSYVTNVNNEVQEDPTIIVDGTVDAKKLRKIMKKYSNTIKQAIEDGSEDIEQAINYTNEWLKKIYERLGEISDKLDNLGDGSDPSVTPTPTDIPTVSPTAVPSGCVWTAEDIEALQDCLDRIDANLAMELTEMQATYTFLGQILDAINNIDVDGGRDLVAIIPIITDLPDSDVLDFIDTGDILADLVSSVMPFCFVGFALGLCDKLAAQPVTPRFVLPLKVNSSLGYNVDEEMVIDFSDYEESGFGFIHDFLIAAQCILFILALIWLTFSLLESFNLIFG